MTNMGRPKLSFSFNYEDISSLCGVSTNAVSKAVNREIVDPDDLLSVACYIAAHGHDDARMELMQALIRSGDYVYRGRPKSTLSKRK